MKWQLYGWTDIELALGIALYRRFEGKDLPPTADGALDLVEWWENRYIHKPFGVALLDANGDAMVGPKDHEWASRCAADVSTREFKQRMFDERARLERDISIKFPKHDDRPTSQEADPVKQPDPVQKAIGFAEGLAQRYRETYKPPPAKRPRRFWRLWW